MDTLKIHFGKPSWMGSIELRITNHNTTIKETLTKEEHKDFVKMLLDTVIYEIDSDMHEMFIDSVKKEIKRTDYRLVLDSDIENIDVLKDELKEKDEYISKLEAQISRDRELLLINDKRQSIVPLAKENNKITRIHGRCTEKKGKKMSLRDSVMNLANRCENPLDLLTDISLNCNEEVFDACEKIREELANRKSGATQVEPVNKSREPDTPREDTEGVVDTNKAFNPKKYLGNQKEWINE